ncbi:MAG: DUF951 domain-containing protein [Clostridia bacterium]|nr:DUF951 domain-containing protein [Clostridia bacterium]
MPYALGALVTMKKQHPCGGSVWKVVRLGADVKLQCVTCGKYINLTKDELKRRIDRQGE